MKLQYFLRLNAFYFDQINELSNQNRTLKEELDRSKREIGELKAKKEQEIAQLKDCFDALEVIFQITQNSNILVIAKENEIFFSTF